MALLTMVGSSSCNSNSLFLSHKNKTSTKTRTVVAAKAGANNKKTNAVRKFDSKNRRTNTTTTLKEQKDNEGADDDELLLLKGGITSTVQISRDDEINGDDGFEMPELPGLEKDFWEGPEWDAFGFVVQYLWAFGILFALVACGVAVGTYNEGATDFKKTPAYKESLQSREFLEEPEGSNSDVFESNPTEEAPALE